jgi:hypothetical protein
MTLIALWYLLAAICALLAAVGVTAQRINLLALAVLFLVLGLGTPVFAAVLH